MRGMGDFRELSPKWHLQSQIRVGLIYEWFGMIMAN